MSSDAASFGHALDLLQAGTFSRPRLPAARPPFPSLFKAVYEFHRSLRIPCHADPSILVSQLDGEETFPAVSLCARE